jgi:hypothetical protein
LSALRRALSQMSPALRFVLLVGVMSFFADFTYEGSRSVIGPYLATLRAGALVISVVPGLGEFLGYGLRLVSGRAADGRPPWTAGRRAFGLFTGVCGISWFLGSIVIGALFSVSLGAVVIFCVAAEIAALPLIARVSRVTAAQRSS